MKQYIEKLNVIVEEKRYLLMVAQCKVEERAKAKPPGKLQRDGSIRLITKQPFTKWLRQ